MNVSAMNRPKFRNFVQLEKYIRQGLSVTLPPNYNFDVLRDAIKEMDEEHILQVVIPLILDYAQKLDVNKTLQYIKSQSQEIVLTRMMIANLLAHSFLCDFAAVSYYDSSDINFYKLYNKSSRHTVVQKEKIKCILIYFSLFKYKDPDEVVSYQKSVVSTSPGWENSTTPLRDFVVLERSIFEGFDMTQVNFGNRKVGGGVLSRGALQEEIRFITCPELIVSRLFCPKMLENEALIIRGFLQYADYKGYDDSFRCKGALINPANPLVGPHTMISIDAIDYSVQSVYDLKDQSSKKHVNRELLKAYSGFKEAVTAIVSGNWGGGCYKGDPIKKALIQWIAASVAEKHLYYNVYQNPDLIKDIEELSKKYAKKTVGEAYKDLIMS